MIPWKRGIASQGVKQALDYAFSAGCDATVRAEGAVSALGYADDTVARFIVEDGAIRADALNRDRLGEWINGLDPDTGLSRGREANTPDSYLLLDATVNAPKSFSIAAMLHPELQVEYDLLMDRLRDRTILSWQRELNARRGHAGKVREDLARIEVVELRHERSRALDPHKHRHLWLNAKVQGQDGRWTTVDSRVAMKFQTVINGEGDLAARTDPAWVSALAGMGYTLNADGEIEQLAHLVRPLSRRSNQIEANRAVKLAEWYVEHPGAEPTALDLAAIDQWAWAHGRPDKPGHLDEGDWRGAVIDELTGIDPTVTAARVPVRAAVVNLAAVDRELLAAAAIADADKRSASNGGRFSLFDVRGGAARAVAASGVVSDRDLLTELIEDVVSRAVTGLAADMLPDADAVPAHVKNLMSTATLWLKQDTAEQFSAIAQPGVLVDGAAVDTAQDAALGDGVRLDPRQAAAAAIVAGTDRLVGVAGPAGTGKTTMLKVVTRLLNDQGRQCVVVAPTKKAASVVGREIGANSSSVHALLRDHGWIWETQLDGREAWHQLKPGQLWPGTTIPYTGPREYLLQPGDRVVVDEAGMIDLNAARALAIVATQTGAGVAMIGDPHQVRPVGHSGAMAIACAHANAVVELATVQRFLKSDTNGVPLRDDSGRVLKDVEYAALTLRMRDPEDDAMALQVAHELIDNGHTARVVDDHQVLTFMTDTYLQRTAAGKTVSLVTSTNEEAQRINESIQQGRIARGELTMDKIAYGQHGQALLVGDVVQTRRNDSNADVANRDLWTITGVDRAGRLRLESTSRAGETRIVDAEYVAESVHLAYASTVHGIQGETTDVSVTGPGVDAAGLYVGMTRGRWQNLYLTTTNTDRALAQELADTLRRGLPEVTVEDSREAAQRELDRAALPDHAPILLEVPAWDAAERPYGHVDDVVGLARAINAGIDAERTQAEILASRLSLAEQELARARAQQAAQRDRGETVDPATIEQLQEHIVAVQNQLTMNRAERVTAERMLEQVLLEQTWRNKLSPEQSTGEDESRADRAGMIHAAGIDSREAAPSRPDASGPVIRPRSGRRTGPRR